MRDLPEDWWKDFFDEDYIQVWGGYISEEETEQQVEGLWEMLTLEKGKHILDAPCGYGRLSRPLAEKGARVLGVDQSAVLIGRAESERGALGSDRLRYLLQDLREPLDESGFDAALNIFSSIGYGSEDDDLRVFKTLHGALKPGGKLVLETNHRDAVVALLSRTPSLSLRLPDGTLVIDEPKLAPIRGRVEVSWYWSGPRGSGEKHASLRVYTATELVRLLQAAGFQFEAAFKGCSTTPFEAKGQDMGGRIALLAVRP